MCGWRGLWVVKSADEVYLKTESEKAEPGSGSTCGCRGVKAEGSTSALTDLLHEYVWVSEYPWMSEHGGRGESDSGVKPFRNAQMLLLRNNSFASLLFTSKYVICKRTNRPSPAFTSRGQDNIIELSTRGTVNSDNWFLGLPEQAMTRSYHPLGYG
ncbi:MAG: hypothetical protein J3R72DRAFT_424180 [Linnemannia gamsii]|nr:MAG: hypothetical protein J3R72DRAFT_424180 [Linnemannia gamsii]